MLFGNALRILREKSSKVLTLLISAGILLTVIVSPKYPEKGTVANFRILPSARYGQWHANELLGRPNFGKDKLNEIGWDDIGLGLLATAAFLVQPSYLDNDPFNNIPSALPVLLHSIFAMMMLLLYFQLRTYLGQTMAFSVVSLYLLSSNFRSIALAADIYLFPLYALVFLMLALKCLVSSKKSSWLFLGCSMLGILACEVTRSSSSFVCIGIVLAMLFPGMLLPLRNGTYSAKNVRIKGAVALALFLSLYSGYKASFPGAGHPFWHALHAGLMEFGGHIGPDKSVYPSFVPKEEVPPGSSYVDSWSDYIQYDLAYAKDPYVKIATPEYEQIIKEDFQALAAKYPLGLAELVLRRVWRLLNINLWGPSNGSGVVLAMPLQDIHNVLLLLLILIGISVVWRQPSALIVVSSLPLLASPLLVYSGNWFYNIPGQFSLTILCVIGAYTLGNRVLRIKPNGLSQPLNG